MKRIAYTAGYLGHSPAELLTIADKLNAKIVDIRYVQTSRDPRWRFNALVKFLKWRFHGNAALGNVRYKAGPPVEIVNIEAGIEDLLLIPACLPIILLCACREAETCHRSVVGAELVKRGWEVRELDWNGAEVRHD